jgi:hypothetical protein
MNEFNILTDDKLKSTLFNQFYYIQKSLSNYFKPLIKTNYSLRYAY